MSLCRSESVGRHDAPAPAKRARVEASGGSLEGGGDESRGAPAAALDRQRSAWAAAVAKYEAACGANGAEASATGRTRGAGGHDGASGSTVGVTRVVALTGGPCAGKSTALAFLSDQLSRRGADVLTVPEAATEVMSNGVRPPTVPGIACAWQSLMLRTMLSMEDSYKEWAKLQGAARLMSGDELRPSVLICDRGALDGASFVDADVWRAVLEENGTTTKQLMARYDLVVHLVTAAIGAEKHYEAGDTALSNPARFHSAEQAAECDRATYSAWEGHPDLVRVDNSTDFSRKVMRVLRPICRLVGLPEPKASTVSVTVRAVERAAVPVRIEDVRITIVGLRLGVSQLFRHGTGSTVSSPRGIATRSASASGSDAGSALACSQSPPPPAAIDAAADVAAGAGAGRRMPAEGAVLHSLQKRRYAGAFLFTRREQKVLGSGKVQTRERPISEREYLATLHSVPHGEPVDEELWSFYCDGRFYTLKSWSSLRERGLMRLECEVSRGETPKVPPFLKEVGDSFVPVGAAPTDPDSIVAVAAAAGVTVSQLPHASSVLESLGEGV